MFDDFLNNLKEFAENTSHIESVIIVGSYARGTNKANSDLGHHRTIVSAGFAQSFAPSVQL